MKIKQMDILLLSDNHVCGKIISKVGDISV